MNGMPLSEKPMGTRQPGILVMLFLLVTAGCGKIPLISENRDGFPPWEKLPESNGIKYLNKFTHDPGTDPIYLARISYKDEAALQLVIDTFALVPVDDDGQVSSFAEVLAYKGETPNWFPLDGVTETYVFPPGEQEYVSNLWVDSDEKVMILERSWW